MFLLVSLFFPPAYIGRLFLWVERRILFSNSHDEEEKEGGGMNSCMPKKTLIKFTK